MILQQKSQNINVQETKEKEKKHRIFCPKIRGSEQAPNPFVLPPPEEIIALIQNQWTIQILYIQDLNQKTLKITKSLHKSLGQFTQEPRLEIY